MITAIILTFNEELHIERCILSIKQVTSKIIVVDSYSTDRTEEICKKHNVIFLQNVWVNYSNQLNWALTNVEIQSDWILRIDADEILSKELIKNLDANLNNTPVEITAYSINRLMYFFNTPLKYGDMYPISHIRLWRNGYGRCEKRWMDERILISSGKTLFLKGDIIDNNLNSLNWWLIKHSKYAIREAIDYFDIKNIENKESHLQKLDGKTRRKAKMLYYKIPIFLRPWCLFIYRYLFRFGFLDGANGFVWHFLQCLWYRLLVDINIREAKLSPEELGPKEYLLKKLNEKN